MTMTTENDQNTRWHQQALAAAGRRARRRAARRRWPTRLYWAQVLRYHQTTDDAYVNGNVVQITPQISGTVVAIGADDTQFVKAGQPLVRLDQADAKVALDQAEAQLARTVRDVRNLFATSSQLEAAVQVRQTDLAAAQSDLARRAAAGQLPARSPGRSCSTPVDAVKAAQASLLAAQQQLAANKRAHRPHDARGPSAGARCGRGGAQRLSAPCRARSCPRRWPASSRAATCSSASASVRARR